MGSSGTGSIGKNLNSSTESLKKSFDKLSSGSRITKAADDAAGLAIAAALASDAVVYSQASRNISDAQSLTEIKDAAISTLSDIGTRLQELSVQSANGTLSDTQRSALNNEFQQLSQEASRIVGTTSFNGRNLFDGQSVQVQAGADGSTNSQISVGGGEVSALVQSITSLSIDTQASATNAINSLGSFVSGLASARGEIGASQSRLDVANKSVQSSADTARAAESRIRDVDVASETANLTAAAIRQQSGAALYGQASKLNAVVVQQLLK